MPKFEIKNRWNGSILFECEALSLKLAVEAAVSKGVSLCAANLSAANLSDADLSGANLRAADLRGANLRAANLSAANLRDADLSGADMSDADLRATDLSDADLGGADLSDADLGGANLRATDLSGADLSGADLSGAKDDYLGVLSVAKGEVLGLYDAIQRGKIDGSVYEGECACLVGTIANVRKEQYDALGIDLRPMASRPAEKWFLNIRKGHTPLSSQVSAITAQWTEDFMTKEGIKFPAYKIVAVEQN